MDNFLTSFRGNHKVEEACEMYARAANMFKMAKNWSGMCFLVVQELLTSSLTILLYCIMLKRSLLCNTHSKCLNGL